MKKIKNRISRNIQHILELWTTDYGDGIPIIFSDNLVVGLFGSTLDHMALKYYKLGIKHERKNRARIQSRKFQERTEV
jgi:hypothetical protein